MYKLNVVEVPTRGKFVKNNYNMSEDLENLCNVA